MYTDLADPLAHTSSFVTHIIHYYYYCHYYYYYYHDCTYIAQLEFLYLYKVCEMYSCQKHATMKG